MKMFGKKAMKLNLFTAIALLGCFPSLTVYAQSVQLSQQVYDQKMQHYRDVINLSKKILDDPSSVADTETKSRSFCERMHAYKQIEKLSNENRSLDMAPVMLMAAQNFLERQQKSLSNSGINSEYMCAEKEKP
jgi:hypothetical protein